MSDLQRTATFFTAVACAHARSEEESLYAFVARWAEGGAELTKTLREEHELTYRWSAELDQLANAESADVQEFVRLAYGLTRLLSAHLETENRMFVPLLEQARRNFEAWHGRRIEGADASW